MNVYILYCIDTCCFTCITRCGCICFSKPVFGGVKDSKAAVVALERELHNYRARRTHAPPQQVMNLV